ncbi:MULTISPECIES: MogA/MoaB family molybdenum cofactor biosynthesis protein [Halolamina]|uniref:Molybdenum cofactor biosynthesis protein B n=1 Tax=Halolamina pelagica TaxID=699431 RepID=A0A1I5VIM0_9EURY|nr:MULTISPECIES: MogA/MoaB family molybdenum cofactor biosynthesis protein [Halolamina]NHX37653.1 MogA/MoaB family molybdenum cofactor biosynthesis protein [Halolamina sp. R1-12]SFQ07329.1 molybdenum cofactor biosynthesis protein B [Halolamina pelagica]
MSDEHANDDHSHDPETHEHDQPGTHEHHSHDQEHLGVAVLTVSSSRSLDDDDGGDRIVDALEGAGHEVATRDLLPDDYDKVQGTVQRFADRDDVDIVITTGGTGVTPDDVTVEAVEQLFDKELPGFGELFRRRSYEEIGTMVVATRATAGVADGTPVFSIPGSENAATLGAELVVSSAGHLAGLAGRDDEDDHDGEGEHEEN